MMRMIQRIDTDEPPSSSLSQSRRPRRPNGYGPDLQGICRADTCDEGGIPDGEVIDPGQGGRRDRHDCGPGPRGLLEADRQPVGRREGQGRARTRRRTVGKGPRQEQDLGRQESTASGK